MKNLTKWLRLRCSCPEKITEAVSDLIGVLSGVGVEIRPLPDLEKNRITGFFALEETENDQALESASNAVRERVTFELEKLYAVYNLLLTDLETEIINDEDWATSWQKFFTPFEIIPGLVIKPSWEEYDASPGQKVITMDPGMAFGTGQHATTRLALNLISFCFTDGNTPRTMLDVGTGTGILAMAGAVFGADRIMAIDNDPEAVEVARRNIRANYMDWNIGVSDRPLAQAEGPFDLICANIVHDVLVEMAPDLERLTSPGGRLILSGILRGRQEKNIGRVFGNHKMQLLRNKHEEEWAGLLLTRF